MRLATLVTLTIAGAGIMQAAPAFDVSPAITPAVAAATAAAAERLAAYELSGRPFGPVLNAGTQDAAVMVDGIPVQLQYLHCVPALRSGAPGVTVWEDGSVTC